MTGAFTLGETPRRERRSSLVLQRKLGCRIFGVLEYNVSGVWLVSGEGLSGDDLPKMLRLE